MFQSLRRPLLTILALGLLAGCPGCDRRPKLPDRPAAPTPVQPPEGARSLGGLTPALQLDGILVTALSEDHRAEVSPEPGWTYEWVVEGARITSGWSASEVRYTAGEAGQVTLTCRVRDVAGREGIASGAQTIVPAPVLATFEANPPILTLGGKSALRWDVREVTRLQLDPGAEDVLRLGGLLVQPTETTTYLLTATNQAGTEVQKTVLLKVVPPPVITAFSTEGSLKVGQPLTLKGDFADGKAEIRQNGAVLAASNESPLKVQVNPTTTTMYSLVVTNEGGATVTLPLTVSLMAPGK